MSNLAVRIISALVMGLVGFTALVLNLHSRWAVIALILALGAWEYSRMVSSKLQGPRVAWLPAVLVLLFSLSNLPGVGFASIGPWTLGIAVLATLVLTMVGFRYVEIATMAPWIYLQLFGCAYFGIYGSALYSLLNPEIGWRGIFPLFMVQLAVAAADTGAYISGKAFGKHKLCPTISSGKTVEGAIGGAILTMVFAATLGPVLLGTGLIVNLGLGFCLAGAAIIGDLFISILKRHAGFKDSSHIIPGHGGVLDRFDALFYTAPVAVLYLQLFRG